MANESKDIFNAPAESAKPENKQVATPAATPGKAPAPSNPLTPATAPAAPVNVPAATTQAAAPAIPAKLADLTKCFTLPRKAFLAAVGDTPENQQRFAREINFAMQILMDKDYLLTCARQYPDYLVEAIKNVALMDLSLNPTLNWGYLIPYKGKVQFRASYAGKVELILRAGLVRKIEATPVFECDKFKVTMGLHPDLIHEPDFDGKRTRETLKNVYWIATLPNGMTMWDVVPIAQILESMNRSEAVKKGQTSPWQTDFIAMARKTAINRAFDRLPKSNLTQRQIEMIEADARMDREEYQDYLQMREATQPDIFEETGYEEVK